MKETITLDEALAQISALKKQVKSLAKKNEKFAEKIDNLTIQNKELNANYNWILEQLKLSKKKMYGASAEKITEEYGQLNLFNEAKLERQPLHVEPQIEGITYTRKNPRNAKQKAAFRVFFVGGIRI